MPGEVVVIVLEDEPLIRLAACLALEEAGFSVLETCHADEALRTLEDNAHKAHALFTDVNVPGLMDGLELAHHTRQHWPHISILIVSGRVRPRQHELPVGARFVAKPYELDHVVGQIQELCAA